MCATQLERLTIAGRHNVDAGLLSSIASMRAVTALLLPCNRSPIPKAKSRCTSDLPPLNMVLCPSSLSTMTQLKLLDLSNQVVTPRGLSTLAQALPRLSYLILCNVRYYTYAAKPSVHSSEDAIATALCQQHFHWTSTQVTSHAAPVDGVMLSRQLPWGQSNYPPMQMHDLQRCTASRIWCRLFGHCTSDSPVHC